MYQSESVSRGPSLVALQNLPRKAMFQAACDELKQLQGPPLRSSLS